VKISKDLMLTFLLAAHASLILACSIASPPSGKRIDGLVTATIDPNKYVLRRAVGGDSFGGRKPCGPREIVYNEFALLEYKGAEWVTRCLTREDEQSRLKRKGALVAASAQSDSFNVSFVDIKAVPPPPFVVVVPPNVTVLVADADGRLLVAYRDVVRSVDAKTGLDAKEVTTPWSNFNASCDSLSFSKSLNLFRSTPSSTAAPDCHRITSSCGSGNAPRFFRIDFDKETARFANDFPTDSRTGVAIAAYGGDAGTQFDECKTSSSVLITAMDGKETRLDLAQLVEACSDGAVTTAVLSLVCVLLSLFANS
jgi:hypothetical protein